MLWASLLAEAPKNAHLQFGVVRGYVEVDTKKGTRYTPHAVLGIKQKGVPNRVELYEVTGAPNPPTYIGSTNFRLGDSSSEVKTDQGTKLFVPQDFVPLRRDPDGANGPLDSGKAQHYHQRTDPTERDATQESELDTPGMLASAQWRHKYAPDKLVLPSTAKAFS